MSKKTKETAPEGRPTKYQAEYAEQARKLCLLGATDTQLATFFEVSESTINLWKKEHTEFSEAVKGGKMVADAEVASALYKRAVGFSYNEVTFERIDSKSVLENADDNALVTEPYKKKIVTKLVAPDVGAQMNWLKNRQRELWRDNLEIDFNKLTDDQLDVIIKRLTENANKA